MADAYRYALKADIGMENGGGFRNDINAGDITYGDIIGMLPYDNTLRRIMVSAEQLQTMLTRCTALVPVLDGNFPQVSGLRFTIHSKSHTVSDIEILQEDGSYAPIDMQRTYSVALTDYNHNNGGFFDCFKKCVVLEESTIADVVLMKDNSEERFPLVDEAGQVIGSATRGECHNGSKLLHPVVHLHVFNSKGEVYLQKRPEWKDIQPGKWDTSVGGHLDYGETPEQALVREVREELGITDFLSERKGMYVFESRRERELVYVNTTIYDGPIKPSAEELDGGRFWTIAEIREAMGQNLLTPNFESEFKRFFL